MSYKKVFLSVAEVAEIIGLSRPTIYKLVYSEKLPSIKLGAKIMIPSIAIDNIIESICN